MAAVGLLLNPPKFSQSDVSYVSYESCELCKKKKNRTKWRSTIRTLHRQTLWVSGKGRGFLVRRRHLPLALAIESALGFLVMPSKNFRGKAKGKEKAEEKARPSRPSSSKAGPPKGIYIRKPNSKGAPHPWHRNKRAAVKVIFV